MALELPFVNFVFINLQVFKGKSKPLATIGQVVLNEAVLWD
jgi:hypothetical protein